MTAVLSIILKRVMVGCSALFVVTVIIFGATEHRLKAFRANCDLTRSLTERYLS
ncbi:hypothetical protein [Halomonas sp.]|uniref:hypothetical protein n=1 Tax=Halomonas sp. TaxID=1486246 RepID=UPI0035666256